MKKEHLLESEYEQMDRDAHNKICAHFVKKNWLHVSEWDRLMKEAEAELIARRKSPLSTELSTSQEK